MQTHDLTQHSDHRPRRRVAARRKPTLEAETRRVAAHIEKAERAAHAADVSSLDRAQRLVRSLLLSELARYRSEARFPKNRDFVSQTPYFVDADGTRCAMAHLLEVGGERELVARVARDRNHAWIRELADEPRLLAWLAAAGLSVAEAAAIQPSYCATRASNVCGGGWHGGVENPQADGVLEGVVLTADAETGLVTVRIDAIHGDAGSLQVGDVYEAYGTPADVGRHVLSPVELRRDEMGAESFELVRLESDGTHLAHSMTGTVAVRQDLYVEAVMSSDCNATLVADDPAWGERMCSGGSGGCAVGSGGGSDVSTVGILIAVVSTIAARRARRTT